MRRQRRDVCDNDYKSLWNENAASGEKKQSSTKWKEAKMMKKWKLNVSLTGK